MTYTCPMHPQIQQDRPGNCPICGMTLEPKTIGEGDKEEQREIKSLSRKFWIALVLTGAAGLSSDPLRPRSPAPRDVPAGQGERVDAA